MDENNYLIKKIDGLVPYITDKHFAIYPCGERGSFVRNYLENKYQLSVDFLIDNYKAQESKKYIRTDELKELGNNQLIIIIASDSKQYYKEIRKEIRKYVPHKNIIDLFPKKSMCTVSKMGRILWEKLLYPHGKMSFLRSIKNSEKIKLLDVGCGNKSPQNIKAVLNKVYYVGIDVGDYNQTLDSKGFADEYHIVKGEEFAEEIEKYNNVFDVVISSHNIEHCNEPERVLKAMISALKKGGKMYMAFPSEESQYFPGFRNGCLNFYDDSSHNKMPNWKKINSMLSKHNMIRVSKGYFVKIIYTISLK